MAIVSLAVTLFLMADAVRLPGSQSAVRRTGGAAQRLDGKNPQNVRVERLTQRYRTNAAGIPELEIRGIIRNTGSARVRSADLKCRLRTMTGEETFIEIPIIIPTNLNDLDGGPLNPFSSRKFGVRIGNFPNRFRPEVLGMELVNVSFLPV